jgi:hypothetical protein
VKKDTYYFSHDYNARNDRKMVKLRLKLKMEGIGIYWVLVEMLYEEGGQICFDEIPVIADELKIKKGLIDQVVTGFDLFENDGKCFWSNSVKRRLDKRLEKSEKAKESIRIRWQNTNVIRTNNDSNTIKERKGKENKGKEIKVNINTGDKSQQKNYKDFEETDFINALEPFKDKYPKELLNNFYKYWKEKSPGGKMRVQLEKTWETELRLENWQRNNQNKVNGTYQSTPGGRQSGAYELLEKTRQQFAARRAANDGS